MHFKLAIVMSFLMITSCSRVKDSTKNTIDKTAETAGKVGADVVSKIGQGVQKSLDSKFVFSAKMQELKVGHGKFYYQSGKEATDNILSIYLIFDKGYDGKVNLYVTDENNLEYGRTSLYIKAAKGSAGYYDFIFDKRVNLENKSIFTFK